MKQRWCVHSVFLHGFQIYTLFKIYFEHNSLIFSIHFDTLIPYDTLTMYWYLDYVLLYIVINLIYICEDFGSSQASRREILGAPLFFANISSCLGFFFFHFHLVSGDDATMALILMQAFKQVESLLVVSLFFTLLCFVDVFFIFV